DPFTGVPAGTFAGGDSLVVGFPLIFHLAHWVMAALGSQAPAAQLPVASLYLHPAAMAAWVGIFATSLNLLPGGQLDGGHIVFAVDPRLHRRLSLASVVILLILSWYYWLGWLLSALAIP